MSTTTHWATLTDAEVAAIEAAADRDAMALILETWKALLAREGLDWDETEKIIPGEWRLDRKSYDRLITYGTNLVRQQYGDAAASDWVMNWVNIGPGCSE